MCRSSLRSWPGLHKITRYVKFKKICTCLKQLLRVKILGIWFWYFIHQTLFRIMITCLLWKYWIYVVHNQNTGDFLFGRMCSFLRSIFFLLLFVIVLDGDQQSWMNTVGPGKHIVERKLAIILCTHQSEHMFRVLKWTISPTQTVLLSIHNIDFGWEPPQVILVLIPIWEPGIHSWA